MKRDTGHQKPTTGPFFAMVMAYPTDSPLAVLATGWVKVMANRAGAPVCCSSSLIAKGEALTPRWDKAFPSKGGAPGAPQFLLKLTTHFISLWRLAGHERLLTAASPPVFW